jgi:hypothetical protein
MRVLLATDGSEQAGLARDLVSAIDWPEGSTVRIVAAVEPLDVVLGAPWTGRLAGEVDAQLTADLDAARRGDPGRGRPRPRTRGVAHDRAGRAARPAGDGASSTTPPTPESN